MSAKFTAACVQMTSEREFDPNIRAAADLVRRARDAGADQIGRASCRERVYVLV